MAFRIHRRPQRADSHGSDPSQRALLRTGKCTAPLNTLRLRFSAYMVDYLSGAARNETPSLNSAPDVHRRIFSRSVCEEGPRVNRRPRRSLSGVAGRRIPRNGREGIQGAEASPALD
jgi:hypothetical protein